VVITGEIIEQLASPVVQEFVRENENSDEQQLILRHKLIHNIPSSLLADQIRGRRKAKEKLPLWYSTPGILYPPSLSIEQCSSARTAMLKTEIIRNLFGDPGISCADLTGGFGVDAYYFSTLCREVHYVESNHNLAMIASHNHNLLGVQNIFHYVTRAETFLERPAERFDLIFADPSRRDEANRKVFRFPDCEPDLLQILDPVFSKTEYLLVKASPMLDIRYAMRQLPGEKVFVVSVDNDCKEVLILCNTSFSGEPAIAATNLMARSREEFSFRLSEEQQAEISYSTPLTYLYEPNASILKAGAFKLAGLKHGLYKIHHSTHLFTSEKITLDFPGRIFRIVQDVKPDPKSVAAFFPDRLANVITRNYPLSAEMLKKKTRLKDGGDKYLIAFTSGKRKEVVVAERIK
jgi:hypothetical protein